MVDVVVKLKLKQSLTGNGPPDYIPHIMVPPLENDVTLVVPLITDVEMELLID